MKYIIFIFIFVFTGCTQQRIESTTPNTSYNSIINVQNSDKIESSTIPTSKIDKKIKKISNNTIAIVYPSVNIGKYALEATNSINTYLLYKGKAFSIKTFDMFIQNKHNIINVFHTIMKQHITKIIAMVTKEQLQYLNNIQNIDKVTIYLPLINKYEVSNRNNLTNLHVTFGGISYAKQFKKLLSYSKGHKLIDFYDNTQIGSFLHNFLRSKKIIYSKMIDDNNGRYKYFLKRNRYIRDASIILNTPIVKSSILLSSITAEELTPSMILSTQLNYTPLIFSLTQKRDRRKLIVANSIGKIPLDLTEYSNILGNSISYSWVNYSCIIGAELLSSNNIDFFKDLSIKDNQVIYPVNLYKVHDHSFSLIK